MRRSNSPRVRTACIPIALALFLETSGAVAQANIGENGIPTDPTVLVEMALRLNSLTGEDMKPWRLRVSFNEVTPATRLSDEESKRGTYEELWASNNKYKQSFEDEEYRQSVYGTPSGKAISGGLRFILSEVRQIHEFSQPAEYLKQYAVGKSLEIDAAEINPGESSCIRMISKTQNGAEKEPLVYRFCFDSASRLVRFSINGSDDFLILFRGYRSFNGRSVPTEVELRRHGVVRQTAHLDSLEAAEGVDEAEFQPPVDAQADESEPPHAAMPRSLYVSPAVAAGMLEYDDAPVYPGDAKAAGVSGTVALSCTIGIDGIVHDIHALSGPPALRRAAIEAVQVWRFRPYALNGEKISVGTTIEMTFSLGQPK